MKKLSLADMEKTYTFATGVSVAALAVTPEMKARDRQIAKIWKQMERMLAEQEKLSQLVAEATNDDYADARREGRKQITWTDPSGLRRILRAYTTRQVLDDSAWSAKRIIDDYVAAATNVERSSDAGKLIVILQAAMTGHKRLIYNEAVQEFLNLQLADARLKKAQEIIKAALRREDTPLYTQLYERLSAKRDAPEWQQKWIKKASL